jgi:transcriptional regulator with XRE-family HTH domain
MSDEMRTLRPIRAEELGKRLRKRRRQSSLTQDKVAYALGLPRERFSQMERGERHLLAIEAVDLADYLGVTTHRMPGLR